MGSNNSNEAKDISVRTIDETFKNMVFQFVIVHIAYISLFWLEPLGIVILIFGGIIIALDALTAVSAFAITLFFSFVKNKPDDYEPFWRATTFRFVSGGVTCSLLYNVVANWWPETLPVLFLY